MISRHWEFLLLAASGIALVYTLRVNMSVAADPMMNDLGWTEVQKGYVLSSFYWGYAIGQVPVSYLMLSGMISAKLVFGISVVVPSILTLLVPVCARHSFGMALVIRGLIGFIESASFPCCFHFYNFWIPLQDKTLMIACLLSGTYVGEIIGFACSGSLISASFILPDGSDAGGWPAVFYIFGLSGILWGPLWFMRAYDRPEQHPHITKEELAYINAGKNFRGMSKEGGGYGVGVDGGESGESAVHRFGSVSSRVNSRNSRISSMNGEPTLNPLAFAIEPLGVEGGGSGVNKSLLQGQGQEQGQGEDDEDGEGEDEGFVDISRVPWALVLRKPGFWNLMIAAWCMGFLQFTLLSEVPSYLIEELKFDAETSGYLSTLPFGLMLFVAVGQGQILTYFQKRGMSTINARRIAQTVSMAGPGTGLLLSLAFKDNKWGAYVSVTLATACIGAMQSGISCSYLEFAPKIAPFLNTMGNAVGAVAGIVGPVLISALLTEDRSTGWMYSFIVTAAMSYACLAFWFVFAVHEPDEEVNKLLPIQDNKKDSIKNVR